MSNFIVDVEADGPCPGMYNMVCFGAVLLEDTSKTFYGEVCPMTDDWVPEALAVSGFTRDQHEQFDSALVVMKRFRNWINETNINHRPTFWSDNPAFDWQFINYYFHYWIKDNPFGFSARRIGDFYAGKIDQFYGHTKWKKYRKTRHDHNPVNDALGNAEALKTIRSL